MVSSHLPSINTTARALNLVSHFVIQPLCTSEGFGDLEVGFLEATIAGERVVY